MYELTILSAEEEVKTSEVDNRFYKDGSQAFSILLDLRD